MKKIQENDNEKKRRRKGEKNEGKLEENEKKRHKKYRKI